MEPILERKHALAGICNNGSENRIRENKDIYTAHLYLRSKCNNKGQEVRNINILFRSLLLKFLGLVLPL